MPTYPFEKIRQWLTPEQNSYHHKSSSYQPIRPESDFFDITRWETPDLNINAAITNKKMSQFYEYCSCLLIEIFQKMGVFTSSGKTYTIPNLIETLNIIPFYHALFHDLILILSDFNYIRLENNQLTTLEAVENTDEKLSKQSEQMLSLFPELKNFTHLLLACINAYPEILTGQISNMNVMFPNG